MEKLTRKKAIRLKCLDCCCGSSFEVRMCPSKTCPLWIYRLGRAKNDDLDSEEVEMDESSSYDDEEENSRETAAFTEEEGMV